MHLLRKLLGLDFADPEPRQVWASPFSRPLMVSSVERSAHTKTVVIRVRYQLPFSSDRWSSEVVYATSLREWRWNLRDERRNFESFYPVSFEPIREAPARSAKWPTPPAVVPLNTPEASPPEPDTSGDQS